VSFFAKDSFFVINATEYAREACGLGWGIHARAT